MHLLYFLEGKSGGEGPLGHEHHQHWLSAGELVEVSGTQDSCKFLPRNLSNHAHLLTNTIVLSTMITSHQSPSSRLGCSVSLPLKACLMILVALRFLTSPLISRSFKGLDLYPSFILRGVTDLCRFLMEMGCPSNCSRRQSRSGPTLSTAARLRNSLQ